MAGRNRPSFIKRQKEQKRIARAAEKREARMLRKSGKAALAAEDGAAGPIEEISVPEEQEVDTEADAGDPA